ncbi:MAG: AAA family ATPase [Hyphomicrobiaceae bacterium]|nr:AAA family ATPase [Hyphomicrobiaceae bacterium]
MIVRAIRLAEVGRFRDPVALEGLTGKLDVLAGPNELGKSTLFAALQAALFQKYSGANKDVQRLVPYQGGAPLIEVDFDAAGTRWRLRKRFSSQKMAELLDLGSGRVLKNADADGALAEVLKGPDRLERFGLLWVGQDTAIADLVAAQPGAGLSLLVESEIAALSVDAVARGLHERVKAELATMQTAKTSKPINDWLRAIKERDHLVAATADAQARHGMQSERLQRLSVCLAERDALCAPELTAHRAADLQEAQSARAEAEKTSAQRLAADNALAAAQAALAMAEKEHQVLSAREKEIVRLADDESKTIKQLAGLAANIAQASGRKVLAEAEVARLQGEIARCGAERALAEAHARAKTAAVEHAALQGQIADARSLMGERAVAEAEAQSLLRFTAGQIDVLKTQSFRLSQLEASLAESAPEVFIRLDRDGAGKILRDGQPVTESVTFQAETAVHLSIPGVGDIRVCPNSASASVDKARDRESVREQLTQSLALLGVATIGDAEVRLRERTLAEQRARDAGIRYEARAPQGIEALVTRLQALAPMLTVLDGMQSFPQSVAEVETQLVDLRQKLVSAQNSLGLVTKDLDVYAERQAGLEASRAQFIRELALKRNVEGGGNDPAVSLSVALERLSEARARFTSAKQERDAWGDDGSDIAELDAAVVKALGIEKIVERRIADIEREIAEINAALAAVRDDDIEAAHVRLTEELGAATTRLSRLELRVEALRRLDRDLSMAVEAQCSMISAPVLNRVTPYLEQVFGQSNLSLDTAFAPDVLTRGASKEVVSQLSHGTREQIAILVRLGLAKLLAERGAAVPVVLDDALVYADDRRISSMFGALGQASAYHQVIVLTCREATFTALANSADAHLLDLQSWTP